jgi:condensin-2 complex subunit D3
MAAAAASACGEDGLPREAAALYVALLGSPGFPAFALFDPVAFESALVQAGRRGGAVVARGLVRALGPGRLALGSRGSCAGADAAGTVAAAVSAAVEALSQDAEEPEAPSPTGGGAAGGEGDSATPALNTEEEHERLDSLLAALLALQSKKHGDLGTLAAAAARGLAPAALSKHAGSLAFLAALAGQGSQGQAAVAALARSVLVQADGVAASRAAAASCCAQLAQYLDAGSRASLAGFVARLSRARAPRLRLAAVAAASELIRVAPAAESLLGPTDTADGSVPWGVGLILELSRRGQDRTAAVRQRALAALASSLLAAREGAAASGSEARENLKGWISLLHHIPAGAAFPQPEKAAGGAASPGVSGGQLSPATAGLARLAMGTPGKDVGFAGGHTAALDGVDVRKLACRRLANDPKAMVRRASLQCLWEVVLVDGSLQEVEARALGRACQDPSVMVRKQAADVAAGLLAAFQAPAAVALWFDSVLPHAADAEASVRAKCLESFERLFLEDLGSAASRELLGRLGMAGPSAVACAGRLMAALAKANSSRARKLGGALQALILEQGGSTSAAVAAEDVPSVAVGAWVLLAELAPMSASAINIKKLSEAWAVVSGRPEGRAARAALGAIGACARRFKPAEAAAICEELVVSLRSFQLPARAAAAHVGAVSKFCQAMASPPKGPGPMQVFVCKLLEKAEEEIAEYMDAGMPEARKGPAGLAVFTAGELVALSDDWKKTGVARRLRAVLGAGAQGSAAPGAPRAAQMVQAYAWVALGKCALADEGLAKDVVPLMFRELSASDAAAVRNNIVVALSDLCVRHTSLVDVHVGKIAACLGDPCEVVRRQTLVLLAGLLQKEYVKWRGPIFNRFLMALVDESRGVRQLVEYLLSNSLAGKIPMLAYNHFAESIFVLNNCDKHPTLGGNNLESHFLAADSGVGGAVSLAGGEPAERQKRRVVYGSLLRRMAPEHKFAVAARLCTDVLAKFVSGDLAVGECAEVMRDTLWILSSQEIKVSAPKPLQEEEEEMEEAGQATAAAMKAAKGKLVVSMMKKHLIESIVPIVQGLKELLSARQSPLLGDLMACACGLFKEYKTELADILAADRQLYQEIMLDIKREEQKQRALARQGMLLARANRAGPGAPGSPGLAIVASRARPVGTDGTTPVAAEVLAGGGQPTVQAGRRTSRGAQPGAVRGRPSRLGAQRPDGPSARRMSSQRTEQEALQAPLSVAAAVPSPVPPGPVAEEAEALITAGAAQQEVRRLDSCFDAAQGDENAGRGTAERVSTPKTRAAKRNLTPGPRGTTPRKKLQEMQQSPHE